jgi:uncharacterized membrane protein (DUF373 family)
VIESRRKRRSFLQWVDAGEKQVAILLTAITAVVIAASIVQLTIRVALSLITNEQDSYWLGDGLIRILGDLLTVLIALEVLQNITSYLRRHVVQIELVLVTALTAVARKVIVLPKAAEDKPQLLVGLGVSAIALAGAYWLVKRSSDPETRLNAHSSREQATPFQDQHPSSQPDDVDRLAASADPPR